MFSKNKPTRYVITCPARTGSTMLVHSLRSHPEVVCHGEVFGPETPPLFGLDMRHDSPLRHKMAEIRQRDPAEFLNDYVFYAGPFSAIGLKFKYEELSQPKYRTAFDSILNDHDILIIHLLRMNLLERYVSQIAATRVTKRFNTTNPKHVPKSVRLSIPPKECEKEFSFTEERQEHFRECFQNHQVLDLTYEDLVTSYDASMDKVQAFLQVPVVALQTKTQKMLSKNLSDVLDNYDEIQDHFRNTRYAQYCH